MIRILLAEDQAMVRGALSALLGLEPDLEVVGFELRAHVALEAVREVEVVEGRLRRRVGVEEVGDDHRRAVVVGDELADVAADDRVAVDLRDLLGRELVGGDVAADHVLRLEALLGDLQHARRRRPQRADGAPVHPGQEHHRLRDFRELLQERRVPHVAVPRAHDDHDAVRAEDLVAILLERADVFVALRQLLVETGRHPQLRGEHAHHDREERERREHEAAVREEGTLEALDGAAGHLRSCINTTPRVPAFMARTSTRR